MADEKISDMTSASSLADADLMTVVQGGVNKKSLLSVLKTYIGSLISDTAYGASWNGATTTGPSKNAVYDQLHLIDTADDGSIVHASTGFRIGASPTAGKMLKSDGTNFIASTETYSTPSVPNEGEVLLSDGANWVATDIAAWTIKKVTGSNATTTGQALVDITGLLTDTLLNSTLYEIKVVLLVGTSSGTDGTEYGLHGGGTGTAASCNALLSGTSSSATAASLQTLNAIDTASSAMLTATSIDGTIVIKGWVVTRSTGTATISIQHLKVVSGTSTVKIGSIFKYRLA